MRERGNQVSQHACVSGIPHHAEHCRLWRACIECNQDFRRIYLERHYRIREADETACAGLINSTAVSNSLQSRSSEIGIHDGPKYAWTWNVGAFVDGRWGDWSEAR
jgi:hypothetical protein